VSKVEVRLVPHGSGYRLDLYYEGMHIGEYERSMVTGNSSDRDAKVREAEGASDLLVNAYERHGKITLRWNGATRPKRKEIRAYLEDQPDLGLGADVFDTIPRRFWRKP
jgi:hypothetical protein